VTVSVAHEWLARAGAVRDDGGFYSVSSITDATTVVLTNLGYAGNASSGTVIAPQTVSAGG